jgi:hypothetical protein
MIKKQPQARKPSAMPRKSQLDEIENLIKQRRTALKLIIGYQRTIEKYPKNNDLWESAADMCERLANLTPYRRAYKMFLASIAETENNFPEQ